MHERTQTQALDELSVTRQRGAELEREQLLYTLQRRNTQLQTAAQVSKSASTILVPAALICKGFDFYYVGLFLVDEVGQQMLQEAHRLAVGGESMIGWCVANADARIAWDVREPTRRNSSQTLSNDVSQEAQRFANPHLPQTRSEMALPLMSGGQCIGALTVQSARKAAFSEQDVALTNARYPGYAPNKQLEIRMEQVDYLSVDPGWEA